jgi:hypothetical protein
LTQNRMPLGITLHLSTFHSYFLRHNNTTCTSPTNLKIHLNLIFKPKALSTLFFLSFQISAKKRKQGGHHLSHTPLKTLILLQQPIWLTWLEDVVTPDFAKSCKDRIPLSHFTNSSNRPPISCCHLPQQCTKTPRPSCCELDLSQPSSLSHAPVHQGGLDTKEKGELTPGNCATDLP